MTQFQAVWRDGLLHPLARYHNSLAAEFGDGEIITLERREERSWKSHGHYFVCVGNAFDNLPEDVADRWSDADHLRKWALIRAGYRDERTFVCASKAEAKRYAAFLKPMDPYAVVVVREAVVIVYTARSQSLKAMGKTDFQESKTKVLDVLADLLGVEPTALRKAA